MEWSDMSQGKWNVRFRLSADRHKLSLMYLSLYQRTPTDAPCVLLQEVARLKGDKLELLRQNVAAQREVKRLRERELQLSSDLGLATREVQRLRCWHMLLEYSNDNGGLM